MHYCFSLAGENSFKKTKISEIPEKELLEFASLDGALIININSELIGIGQQLDPPSSKKAYKEPGRGTRHHSAAGFSEAVDSAVFVVSENGSISLFFKGALFARCFEELFGS